MPGIKPGMRSLTTLLLFVLQTIAGAQAPTDVHGTWTAEIHTGKVYLQIRPVPPPDLDRSRNWNHDWNMGQSVPIEELQGLANSDQFTMASVTFDLRREAGSTAFAGSFREGRGAGLFTFAPRAAYTAEMKSLGYADDLPLWRRFQLAVHDVGPKYVRDLKSEGYDKLTLDHIQRARTHGVTIDYIKEIKGQGFKVATLEEMVRARDHGVKPEYVLGIRRLGLGVTTLEQFIRLRDHGVTVDYVKALEGQGFRNVPVEDIVRTKDHGVSAEFVADMKEIGLKGLTLPQLVRLRDHGITPGFVNHARARGYRTTDPDELVRLKNGGLWK